MPYHLKTVTGEHGPHKKNKNHSVGKKERKQGLKQPRERIEIGKVFSGLRLLSKALSKGTVLLKIG